MWDLSSQYYTHNLRTQHTVATCLVFHPAKLLLYAGWTTGALTAWDLASSKLAANMEAHFSAVTQLAISRGGERAVSGGRDSVVVVWDLATHTKLATVPVFGPVEGLQLLPGSLTVVLATEQKLAIWSLEGKPRHVTSLDLGSSVTSLAAGDSGDTCHVTTSDHNLVTVAVTETSLAVADTVVGDNDQVLALGLLGADSSHLAVACNSPLLRVYSRDTWRCELVPGHADTVLCLAVHADGERVATGSKDNTVRVWRLGGAGTLASLAAGAGHTQSVGGVAWCGDAVASVSADTTLKVWSVQDTGSGGSLVSVRTEIAHEKDINCVAVSPDGGLIVTGGQDKLAKLWRSSDLGQVMVYINNLSRLIINHCNNCAGCCVAGSHPRRVVRCLQPRGPPGGHRRRGRRGADVEPRGGEPH